MTSSGATNSETRRRRPAGLLVAAVVLALGGIADAHPISVVTESAYVERDKLTIDVEVFAEDLYFYHGLKANEKNEVPAEILRQTVAKHGDLLLERLPVFDASGTRLEGGRVASVSELELPEAVPLGELMGYSLVYRLERPFEKPPEFLSFTQRLVGPGDGFPALVDFKVKQAGKEEEVTTTLKPGNVKTVRLDWSEGGAAGTEAERETWMKEQREDALGATALNTVGSFFYIMPREVRHELLIPFPLVESYFTIDRADPDFLTHEEQEAAKPKVAEFFRGKNPVTIDGEVRTPARATVEFFTLDDRDLTKKVKRRTVSAVNARVGVILSYPLTRPASEAELEWNAFNRQAWKVDAFCFAGEEVLRPKFSAATRSDRFVWKRPTPPMPEPVPVARAVPREVSIPWLSVLVGVFGVFGAVLLRKRPAAAAGLATAAVVFAAASWGQARLTISSGGAPSVSPEEADAIARTLHGNLYRAADAATDEEAVEALAAAADGELLRSLALQLIENMRSDDPDGSVLAVRGVRVLSAERVGEGGGGSGFGYAMSWDVTARLEHWGHVHDRRYLYDAEFRIEPRDGRWLITAIDLKDARLIEESAEGLL
jgi:hypothetical protein